MKTTTKTTKTHEMFLAAMNHMIDNAKPKHGAITAMQQATRNSVTGEPYSYQHVSDVRTGKKGASQELQEQVAAYFGFSLLEFLRLGEERTQPTEPFPGYYDVIALPEKSDRVLAIYHNLSEQLGIQGLRLFNGDTISNEDDANNPDFIKKYYKDQSSLLEVFRDIEYVLKNVYRRFQEEAKKEWFQLK